MDSPIPSVSADVPATREPRPLELPQPTESTTLVSTAGAP